MTHTVHTGVALEQQFMRRTNRPGCTWSLLEPLTQKVVATATADTNGLVVVDNVPPGRYLEKISYSVTDSGATQTFTSVSASPDIFGAGQSGNETVPGPILGSPNGNVYKVVVDNSGNLSTVKLA